MDDRYFRYGTQQDYTIDRTAGRDDGSADYGGRDFSPTSAREYAAVDERNRGYRDGGSQERSYGGGGRNYDRDYGGRPQQADRSYGSGYAADRDRSDFARRGYDDDRNFFDRAGDEVRSWFGDEEADRRRTLDQKRDAYRANHPDEHYRRWRSDRISELDRDYHEYSHENAKRFENEFNSWRTERQGQRDGLTRVAQHMEVVGSDGDHLGTVDKVHGDRILLTKSDPEAGGHHHSIPSRWIKSVDDKVTLAKTADQARDHWRDEERGAMGWDRDAERTNLGRAFKGTY